MARRELYLGPDFSAVNVPQRVVSDKPYTAIEQEMGFRKSAKRVPVYKGGGQPVSVDEKELNGTNLIDKAYL